jgi:hypothetical protein
MERTARGESFLVQAETLNCAFSYLFDIFVFFLIVLVLSRLGGEK